MRIKVQLYLISSYRWIWKNFKLQKPGDILNFSVVNSYFILYVMCCAHSGAGSYSLILATCSFSVPNKYLQNFYILWIIRFYFLLESSIYLVTSLAFSLLMKVHTSSMFKYNGLKKILGKMKKNSRRIFSVHDAMYISNSSCFYISNFMFLNPIVLMILIEIHFI